jgi:membrane protein implicated in regulation of membrane protease activity
MISISLEDLVFAAFGLAGLVLAVATVVFGYELGEALDRLGVGVETARAPVAALLIGFISLFGLGGLVAVRILDVHGGFAVLAGMVSGVLGAIAARAVSEYLRASEYPGPPSMRELVGRPATVAVAVPAGRFGSVYVKAEGRTHEYSATAGTDIPAGAQVTVTGAVGNGLVVARVEAVPPPRVLTDDADPDPDT